MPLRLFAVSVAASTASPPDTSLETLPVAYYGAAWNRTDDDLELLSRMSVVILMQEDGPCWTTCCPHAQDAHAPVDSQCGSVDDATANPGCDPSCDQHGYQVGIFEQLKHKAEAAGRKQPHCMLYMNGVYSWPFDATSALGDDIHVVDVHGRTHEENCDPGIFPSYMFDFSKTRAQDAWLSIINKSVVHGAADGVYVDCYNEYGLQCPHDTTSDNCTARRNGRYKSLNEEVTRAHVDAYRSAKDETMLKGSQLVGSSGSYYAKNSAQDQQPPHGGNLNFHDRRSKFADPANLIPSVREELQFYKYIIVGSPNGFRHPTLSGLEDLTKDTCSKRPDLIANFLLALEPGMFLLCNGWSELFSRPLGKPLGDAVQNATGGWTRRFASGTHVEWFNGTGIVHWAPAATPTMV